MHFNNEFIITNWQCIKTWVSFCRFVPSSFWGCRTTISIRIPRTFINSQSQEIHRLTSLPFEWVLSFPKDPRAEMGLQEEIPLARSGCVDSLRDLPTPFTDWLTKLSKFTFEFISTLFHPSNIRASIVCVSKPCSFIYILFEIPFVFLYNVKSYLFISILNSYLFHFNGFPFICIYAISLFLFLTLLMLI